MAGPNSGQRGSDMGFVVGGHRTANLVKSPSVEIPCLSHVTYALSVEDLNTGLDDSPAVLLPQPKAPCVRGRPQQECRGFLDDSPKLPGQAQSPRFCNWVADRGQRPRDELDEASEMEDGRVGNLCKEDCSSHSTVPTETTLSQAQQTKSPAPDPSKVDPLTCTVASAGATLAFFAGMVNTITFLALGQFVTHVTGNLTRSGFFFDRNFIKDGSYTLLLIMCFIGGSSICGCAISKSTVTVGQAVYGYALMGSGCLLAVAVAASDTNAAAAACLVAAACGLQNGIATSYSGAAIRTTHVTGTATDIGLIFGRMCMALAKRCCSGLKTSPPDPWEDIRKLRLLVYLFTAFFLGCVFGAATYTSMRMRALLLPAVVSGLAGAFYTIFRLCHAHGPLPDRCCRRSACGLTPLSSFSSRRPPQPAAKEEKSAHRAAVGAVSFAPVLLPSAVASPADILGVLDSLQAPIYQLAPGSPAEHLHAELQAAHRNLKQLVEEVLRLEGDDSSPSTNLVVEFFTDGSVA